MNSSALHTANLNFVETNDTLAKMKTYLIILIGFVAPLTCTAKVKSVKIFHVPWGMMTYSAMSPEAVRKSAIVKVEISDSGYPLGFAERFVLWLKEGAMKKDDSLPVRDLRLVIDVEDENGSISSFNADRFAILEVKSGKQRPIDDSFRARFTSYYDSETNK